MRSLSLPEIEELRNSFVDYAKCYIGRWYRWGGDDPSGFDCSGLVVECLRAHGMIGKKEDMTANMMYGYFSRNGCIVQEPHAGCLILFLGEPNTAYHVEICKSRHTSIGASGGGSRTKTVEDAIRQNAFIKENPLPLQSPKVVFVDPFKILIDNG